MVKSPKDRSSDTSRQIVKAKDPHENERELIRRQAMYEQELPTCNWCGNLASHSTVASNDVSYPACNTCCNGCGGENCGG